MIVVAHGARGTHGGSSSQPASSTSPASVGPHVLVVDDDPDILQAIRHTLDDEGYSVATAANGLQALERIRERRPAVVLVDLTMPVMNGWQLNEQLQELGLGIPVVFMTAAFRARAEAEQHGAAGYLAKPFDIDDLLDTVARFAPPAGG
jgi:two-component system chemotaxis response regulator CheY